MHFPYGISDFATIIREGYFYQDRSDRIALLEQTGRQLVFIRPRRFGKSMEAAVHGYLNQRLATFAHDYAHYLNVDLSLIVRPDMRRFNALDLVIEFKYISLKDLNLSGEQLTAKTQAELEALPAVVAKLDEATEQAQRYGAVLQQRYGLSAVHRFAVVGLGLERVVFRRLASSA